MNKGNYVICAQLTVILLVCMTICSCSPLKVSICESIANYQNPSAGQVFKKVRYYTPQQFGAKADGVTDDTEAIQKATDEISKSGGGVLYFPSGTYLIASFNVYVPDFGYGAIDMRSNVYYKGDKNATIKVADGVNRSGFSWQGVFMGRYGEKSTNVTFDNLIFDLNGSNNLYPYYGDYKHNSCCAAVRTGYPKNIRVINCTIEDCPGLNCLSLGYAHGAVVANNTFLNSADAVRGNKIHDHSCILVAGDNIMVCSNTLLNDSISRVGTAIEINSIGAIVCNNYAKNFNIGCLLSPVGATSLLNVDVYKNTFENNKIAFQVWHCEENTESAHIKFCNNRIVVPSERFGNGNYAIDLRTYAQRSIYDVLISENIISGSKNSNNNSYGGIIIGEKASDVVIQSNEMTDISGTAITMMEGASDITVENNTFINCSNSLDENANRVILLNPGKAVSRNISIIGNRIDNQTSKKLRGIWLINTVEHLTISDNTFSGFESYNEIDAALMKKGQQVNINKK